MAKICPLFSGSSGNATYIGSTDGAVLIDAGVSASRIIAALDEQELDKSMIRAIFITHAHTDHISGVRVLAKRLGVPVYASEGTLALMQKCGAFDERYEYNTMNGAVDLCFARVESFATSHDCEGSCGYTVDLSERKIAVCTDLGYVSDTVHDAICGVDAVVLESNHDVEMLKRNDRYPYPLKRRILSDAGHLSNIACADEAAKLLGGGTTRFILAHLSRENNLPTLAKQTTVDMMRLHGAVIGEDYLLGVAAPQGNGVMIL